MNDVEALHLAARRYCVDRAAQWHRAYKRLVVEQRERITIRAGECEYTSEAWDTFPRAQVSDAILSEVERFVPSDFKYISEARSMLALAGETAQSQFTAYNNPTAARAAQEERQLFSSFVRDFDRSLIRDPAPLPFRRVLGGLEHRRLLEALVAKWGKWYGGYVQSDVPRSDVLTLHDWVMKKHDGYPSLRAAVRDHGITRVFELRESGDGFELEVDSAGFTYKYGSEGFWTSGEMEWMVYASHESSITFGGSWLIEEMKNRLPDFQRYIYRGWDLKDYDLPDES